MTISATKVHFDKDTMTVDLTDGRTLRVPLAWFPRLLNATPAQRARVELSRNGLHWNHLNEDVSVAGLLAGRGDLTKSTTPAKHQIENEVRRSTRTYFSAGKKLLANRDTGLDGRHRDTTGHIHHKMGNTRIGTLRETYGKDFASGWRSDTKLETLLRETGAKSLTDFRKNYNKRA